MNTITDNENPADDITLIPLPDYTPYTDNTATWEYWTPIDSQEQGIQDEWVWERLRLRRDNFLSQSDYRMVIDAPWDVTPWQQYRQALRDLPKKTKDPRLAEWPVAPNE
jgi:hypothetical protein